MRNVLEAQAPRVNGRLTSMDASRQWAPRVNGRLTSMDASRQWTPRLCKQAAHAVNFEKIEILFP